MLLYSRSSTPSVEGKDEEDLIAKTKQYPQDPAKNRQSHNQITLET